ncbi:MAG TPA: zf-HC2 domain-containing protein [Blastocatellia bacterium]|nr:zf-HC2 domain-containing protein [Blastocatellia bacterium]
MRHGISEQEWIDFLDRRLDRVAHARIEAHLADCRECDGFYERLKRAMRSLEAAGMEINRSRPVADDRLNLGLARILARILNAETRQQHLTPGAVEARLNHLEELLSMMCGSWTAVNALRVAAEGTRARSLDQLTPDNWAPFLERLTSIASIFCGAAGAKLVREYGRL